MTSRASQRRTAIAAAATPLLAVLGLLVPASPAGAFGSTNIVGQNAEHQHITEGLVQADPRWQPNSLKLVAGSKGNYGGVAAPDRLNDSSATPVNGLGPGYKHCDDGDYLKVANYPQPLDKANAALAQCGRYYQYLLDRAVRYAGNLVTPDLTVNTKVFDMTKSSSMAPDSVCAYRFSLTPDANAKCDVMNAFGRALHVAEDVWSHTNWGDKADPSRQISIANPPGLGQTDVPGFLRYPAEVTIPEGLISGCDDSAGIIGQSCSGRVTHSVLAKDNGTFNPDGTNAQSTTKYERGTYVVDGVSNFQRAITGARKQAASTWSDLQAAIISTYGEKRGQAIIAVLVNDKAQASDLASVTLADSDSLSDSAEAPDVAADSSGEFAADPANDAPLGTGDKDADLGHSGQEAQVTDDASAGAREAGGAELGATSTDDTAIDAAASPKGESGSRVMWWLVAASVAVLAVITVAVIRRRSTGHSS